jgi:hypothetical protein
MTAVANDVTFIHSGIWTCGSHSRKTFRNNFCQGGSNDDAPDASSLSSRAFVLATGPAQAEMKSQWVEYTHGDTKLKAYMVYDDQMAGRRPAVVGGTSRPSAWAVLRLITSSYLVGACTGRSAGFSPLRMRST